MTWLLLNAGRTVYRGTNTGALDAGRLRAKLASG